MFMSAGGPDDGSGSTRCFRRSADAHGPPPTILTIFDYKWIFDGRCFGWRDWRFGRGWHGYLAGRPKIHPNAKNDCYEKWRLHFDSGLGTG